METVRVTDEWESAFKDLWKEKVEDFFASTTDDKMQSSSKQKLLRGKLQAVLEGLLKEFKGLEGPMPKAPSADNDKAAKEAAPPTPEMLAKIKELQKVVEKKEAQEKKLLGRLKKLEESIPGEIETAIKEQFAGLVKAGVPEVAEDDTASEAIAFPSEESLLDTHNGYMNLFAGESPLSLLNPLTAATNADGCPDVAELRNVMVNSRNKATRYRSTVQQFGGSLPQADPADSNASGPVRSRLALASRFRATPY